MLAQKQLADIRALFSCRCTNIDSYLLLALPGVNVFPLAWEAEISSVFFMTICVGNQTLRDTLILEKEGKI